MNLGDLVTGTPGFLGIFRMLFDQLRRLSGAVPNTPVKHGPVSTSVMQHNGHLYALSEGSLPFKMSMSKNGTLSSIGFDNFKSASRHDDCTSEAGSQNWRADIL